MHHMIGALVIGAFAGGVAGRRARLRPAVRGLVKGGIVMKRKIESLGTTAFGEIHKVVEEARAELNEAGTEPHN
jgi:hypothetical protein